MALTTEARKIMAKGTVVKIDTVVQGRIETVDPPASERETVDAPELNPQDDTGVALTFDPVELGDEIPGEFKFVQYWDPRNVKALALDTAFASKATVAIALVCAAPSDGATLSFSGKIKRLGPQQLAKKNYFKREVTIIRTTAITNAASA
jgi:hypothetical protein